MITRENLIEVIDSLSSKDKKRLLNNTEKEFCVLHLHVFNSGFFVTMKLTNDYNRYKNVYKHGNSIMDVDYVKNVITRSY